MHTKKIIIMCLSVLVLVIGFYKFKTKSEPEIKRNYGIQFIWDCSGILQIREAIKPIANKIIQEELGLMQDKLLFLGKDHQALTLYYIDDMYKQGEEILFSVIEDLLKTKKIVVPKNIMCAHEVDFFGEDHDEFVILVHDTHGQLAQLNKTIKDVVHDLDDQYQHKYYFPVFNRSKSEEFSFVPHIGLGRIRINSIKRHIQDPDKIDKVCEKIKERIKKATLEIIENIITSENQKISFKKLSIACFAQKRVEIKEYLLEN